MTDAMPAPGAPPPYGKAPPPYGEAPPKKSHCFRNCVIVGCLLVLLVVCGGGLTGYLFMKDLGTHMKQGGEAESVADAMAKGAVLPAGSQVVALDNWTLPFSGGKRVKGVMAMKQSGQVPSIIAFGAVEPKPKSLDDLQKEFDRLPQNGGGGRQNAEVKNVEVVLGGGVKHPATRIVSTDALGRKMVQYFILIDPFENEFHFLGIMAQGPEPGFDEEGFKAFLRSLGGSGTGPTDVKDRDGEKEKPGEPKDGEKEKPGEEK